MPTIDSKIKQAQDFIQLWIKYYDVYSNIINKKAAGSQDEELFLDTKRLLRQKFAALREGLKLDNIWGAKSRDIIARLLDLPGILALSDTRMAQLDSDWKASISLFNELLADLQKDRSQRPKSGVVKSFIEKLAF